MAHTIFRIKDEVQSTIYKTPLTSQLYFFYLLPHQWLFSKIWQWNSFQQSAHHTISPSSLCNATQWQQRALGRALASPTTYKLPKLPQINICFLPIIQPILFSPFNPSLTVPLPILCKEILEPDATLLAFAITPAQYVTSLTLIYCLFICIPSNYLSSHNWNIILEPPRD